MAAYLLGMAPMPPPQPEEVAVALANHVLDHPDANFDPRLRNMQGHQIERILVRMPMNDKVTRDIEFPVDIEHGDFISRICAVMNLNVATAQLGWKSNDDPKRNPARQLTTQDDLREAFRSLLKTRNNPRRQKDVVMLIVHLNPEPPQPVKKKTDGNRATDFAYAEELRLVQEKLKCAQHDGPNRWCYISPDDPSEHVKLGLEEVTLWARKLRDDPDLDRSCTLPPNCLSLDKLRDRAARRTSGKTSAPKSALGPAVHIHNHFNNPLGITGASPAQHGLKRAHSLMSDNSEDSDNDESLPLTDVLADLDDKYPKLKLLQYESALEEQGIVYAESVTEFPKEYFVKLGMPEGAVGPFLRGVKKALHREKREAKRAKIDDKENGMVRVQSVEI